MKKRLRVLSAAMLALLLLLACLPLTGLAQGSTNFLGTVVITKSGYQGARPSVDDAKATYRVHYGERYLCVSDDGDGWYGIRMPSGDIVYVSSKPENTTLQDGINDMTLSIIFDVFEIRTDKKAEVYSQPKSSAKMRRVSGDGSTESTFYYPKGTELVAFGMTTRGGKDWYLFLANNNGVREPAWVLAEVCTVIDGDPADNLQIPDWWYD